MPVQVKSLNSKGIEKFEGWIRSPDGAPPRCILRDPATTDDVEGAYEVEEGRIFRSSYELGIYLHKEVFVNAEDRYALLSSHGMWAWISLFYIESLMRRDTYPAKPLARWHYIDTPRLGYRLIARTAWDLVALHGESARVAIGSPRSPWGEMAEQMTSRQEIYANKSFWPVANALYLTADGSVKRGATSQRSKAAKRDPRNRSGLGGVRRLPFTFKQFERTYNLRRMDGKEILELLPREYDRWRASTGG